MAKLTTNTTRHISDKADSVSFDKENTIWSEREGYDNLQDILESITPIAIEEVYATDSNYGLVKIAKDVDLEELRGTDDVVTSKQMFEFNGKPRASYTEYGTTRYATNDEVMKGTAELSVTAKQLQHKWVNDYSTRDSAGTIKLADESMVVPGTNDDTVMTPKLVKLAIDRLVPVPEVVIADEQLNGTVTLANVAVTQQGTIRKGYAISPYAFKNTNATTTIYGTVRCATVAEVRAGSIADKVVVTPKTFNEARATITQVGTTQYASLDETKAMVINNKSVTPSGLKFINDEFSKVNQEVASLKSTKITGGNVVQWSGQSTNDVMSQKAVTDFVNNSIGNVGNKLPHLGRWGRTGWWKDRNTGLIIQWGTVDQSNNSWGERYLSFPVAFEHDCFNLQLTRKAGWADGHGKAGALVISHDRWGARIALNRFNDYQTGTARGYTWMAIGI